MTNTPSSTNSYFAILNLPTFAKMEENKAHDPKLSKGTCHIKYSPVTTVFDLPFLSSFTGGLISRTVPVASFAIVGTAVIMTTQYLPESAVVHSQPFRDIFLGNNGSLGVVEKHVGSL